jgi:hypothetical protein
MLRKRIPAHSTRHPRGCTNCLCLSSKEVVTEKPVSRLSYGYSHLCRGMPATCAHVFVRTSMRSTSISQSRGTALSSMTIVLTAKASTVHEPLAGPLRQPISCDLSCRELVLANSGVVQEMPRLGPRPWSRDIFAAPAIKIFAKYSLCKKISTSNRNFVLTRFDSCH